MKLHSLAILATLSCILCDTVVAELPRAAVTIKVVDEIGTIVAGVTTDAAFDDSTSKSMVNLVKGVTDNSGLFFATARTEGGVSYGAMKQGYYRSVGEMGFPNVSGDRWLPWNPTLEVVLKKIVNPVPMYARKVSAELPELNKPIGYDLTAADWAGPYGKGTQSDFVFRATKRVTGRHDYEAKLTVTFSCEGDGLQTVKMPSSCGSELRLPREAPADGYRSEWVIEKGQGPAKPVYGGAQADQNFIFRVRSQTASDGTQKAIYGKTQGDIEFYPVTHTTAAIRFTYYLNPDGTRNLEFDLKRNLFKNLKQDEEVRQP